MTGDCGGQVQGEACRGLVAEGRVGPFGVVVRDPGRDQIAGMGEVAEQRLVQELVPHPAVEAFDKAVLHRLARRDVVPFDLVLGAPLQDRVRGQFGPVDRGVFRRLYAATKRLDGSLLGDIAGMVLLFMVLVAVLAIGGF